MPPSMLWRLCTRNRCCCNVVSLLGAPRVFIVASVCAHDITFMFRGENVIAIGAHSDDATTLLLSIDRGAELVFTVDGARD